MLYFPQLIITLLICFKSSYSIPTFTNEYVHIKLHVPEKTGEELLKNLQEIEHSGIAPVSYHKVIHHYHKRKRPYVKHSFGKNADNALESIVLSEAAHTTQHDVQENFEPVKNIETYVVKHEPKIKENVKTLKIIEEKKKLPYNHQSHHYLTETFKVIDSKKPHHYADTYKVVETKNPTTKQHYHHTETFKVLDDTALKQHHHPFSYENKFKTEIVDTELRPPPFLSHEITRPIETLKIVKEKTPHTYFKQNVDSYHRPVIQTDTIEITKSQTPYQTSQHINDNAVYTNSYANEQEEQPTYTTSSGYSYEHPSSNYKEEFKLIPKQPVYHSGSFVKSEYPLRIPSSKYQHQGPHYQATDIEESHRYNSGNTDEQIHQVNSAYEEENKNYATPNQYDFARDEDLLSEILDATRNKSPVGYEYTPPKFSQNVASDSIDWPKENDDAVSDNRNAAETYRGVDSYSVNHVQGIGSGGYNYHSPFLKK